MSWDQLVATFQDGDVLYGLDKGRKEAKEAILAAQSKTKVKVLVLGCLPRTKKVDRIIIQNAITDSVFDALKIGEGLKTGGQFLSTDKEIKGNKGVKSDPKRAIGFRDHLRSHPRWNPESGISDEDVKGGGWKANKPKDAKVDIMDRARKAWTRTSKAGLEYHTKVRGSTVHFILNGVDFDRVVGKAPGDVTSAEIRWLFRHRSDPQVMNHVTFWYEGKVVGPPWEWSKNEAIFANYQPKSESIPDDHAKSRDLREVIQDVQKPQEVRVKNLVAFYEGLS